jgi:hypothetical protein
MLKNITYFTVITSSLLFNAAAIAGLDAIDVSVQNTIQSPTFTGGSEDLFGDPQSATISTTITEFPSFVDAYDIDLADNSIAFRWVDTEFSQLIGGPVAANVPPVSG